MTRFAQAALTVCIGAGGFIPRASRRRRLRDVDVCPARLGRGHFGVGRNPRNGDFHPNLKLERIRQRREGGHPQHSNLGGL